MNGLSHKQARRYMLADQDGLLSDAERLDLETHLSGCEACRAESDSLSTLTSRLQSELHERWDLRQDGPSHNVLTNVRSQTRRIAMSNKVSFGLRALAGIVALIVLSLSLNFVISQLRDHSTPASENTAPDNKMPVSSVNAKDRLLAFTKVEDENHDIFTMRPDGSKLTNITNNPAQDSYPSWSPDGRHIAFLSDRDSSKQIYLMDADGSNVIQLTHGEGDYFFDPYDFSPWSPDGKRLIFSHKNPDEQAWELYVMDIDGNNVTTLTDEPGEYTSPSWSPDGEHIAFISGQPSRLPRQIFVVDKDGKDLTQLTKTLPAGENFIFSDYFWSQDGRTVIFTTDSNAGGGYNAKIYAANLDGSLTLISTSEKMVISWWDGTSLLSNAEQTFTWLRPDASQSTLDPCPDNHDLLGITSKRSHNGNLLLSSYCSTIGWTLYWANPEGTVTEKILDSLIPIENRDILNVAWSHDDEFIALDTFDTNTPDIITWMLYILDVAKARKDPSTQPLALQDSYGPSWQPVTPDDNVAEEITQPPSYDGLLAFEKMENGNLDIFTMHPDGSGLTNLTNDSAYDGNPTWSPDGKHIAFTSNRMGGFGSQIFLMDPDGTNVTQLTFDEGDHILPLATSGLSDLWSPDGNKLLYLELLSQSDTEWALRSIDVNTGNVTPLGTGRFDIGNISWSPDGKYIGYTKNDPQNTDENSYTPDLYVVDADGRNPREIKKLIPQDGYLFTYQWSSKEGTIIFMGYKDHPFFIETIYEFNLKTNSLIQKSTLASRTIDWHDGISLVMPEIPETTFIWQRPDGTSNTLDWGAACWEFHFERSLKGNFAIGAYCPDNKSGFYWANSDGSVIKNLLGPLPDDIAGNYRDISFSPDDQFITITIATSQNTNMFVLNVEESLKDPSSQPVKVLIGEGDLLTIPSWQPVISDETIEAKEEIVEENPVLSSPYNGLIAFTSAMESGNLDIYTVHSDGSNLVNLTNNPARDMNPFWSPDGKLIAFESDRAGFTQIFTMSSDGSNLTQVTNGEADHKFDGTSPWSPDGSRFIFSARAPGNETWELYSISVNGENKTRLAQVPDIYSAPSWSPDGSHIAYRVLEMVRDRNIVRIHVVDANGDNNTNVTSLLPEDEDLYSFYSWTQEGNIRFAANRYYWENDNAKYAFYEATLDGKTLVELTKTSTPLVDWWEGATLVRDIIGKKLTWLRSDGTFREFKPYENCQMGTEQQYSSLSRRSSTGYVLLGTGCPNGDLWLYLANPDGTNIEQLLDAPIKITDGGLNDINWSPDSGHVTLTVKTSGITYLYILDVRKALKDRISPPEPITIGGGDINYNISWQPTP